MHAHVRHHEALIGALNDTRGLSLVMPQPIWPVDVRSSDQMQVWGRAHQDLHNELNDLLNIPSQDLTGFDLKDKRKLDGWLYLHLQMHQSAAGLCGLAV